MPIRRRQRRRLLPIRPRRRRLPPRRIRRKRPIRRNRKRPRRTWPKRYDKLFDFVVPHSEARSSFSTTKTANNGLRVSGYDLVYDMNSIKVDETSGTFVTIPANPAYWKGTRVAQIATAYSQYRPIYLRFDYHPAVSMQTGGTVTSGTIWNDAPSSQSVSQALTTSNGGKTHTVWSRKRTFVKMGSNLDQNLYSLNGTFDDDSNPFIFLAILNDPTTNSPVPGYYMCQYTFEFKNPIGDGNEYDIDEKAAGDINVNDVWESTTAVLKSESAGFAPGTILTIQVIAGVVQFLLKGSRLGVAADLVFSLFKNRNKNVQEALIEEDTVLVSYASANLGIGQNLRYTLGNAQDMLKTEDFVPITDIPQENRVYGWAFDIGEDLIRPFYFHNTLLSEIVDRNPNLKMINKLSSLGPIMQSLITADNSGSSFYPTGATSSYITISVQGIPQQIILQNDEPIFCVIGSSEDDPIVGEGSIVMKSKN